MTGDIIDVPTSSSSEQGSADTSEPDDEWVDLPNSDALTELTAQPVLFRTRCSRILLAGAVGSGKTSILTAIYERLCRGDLEDWNFGSSATLIGFEKRCWEGRTNSGGDRDQIGRTSLQSDDYLLHLDLARGDHTRDSLLIADLSGEVFKELKFHPAVAGELPILQSCDHLTIVIDGARLGVQSERQASINDALACLRACVAFGELRPESTVELVVAKWDAGLAAGLTEQWANDHVFKVLRRIARPRIQAVSSYLTASRPTSGDFQLGTGVAALINAWTTEILPPPLALPKLPTHLRQYLRYGS